MEKQNYHDNNNALTEVSLALAMAFFSIMILSIFALSQSKISEMKINIEKNKNDKDKESKLKKIIYYYEGFFYDKNFKKVFLPNFLKNNKKVILSVSPKISLESLFEIKANFKKIDVKITQHNKSIIEKIRTLK